MISGIWPVSYTHLDVYKRQAVYTAEELCRIMGDCPGLVADVWKEEAEACRETARKRQQLFEAGVRKYLDQGNEVI